ncbi:MAG: MalY/PatB family protein [Spirochaetota bacterium]
MGIDFSEVIERRDSDSTKWTRYGRDVLPLWVADMDFRAPAPILEALQRAVAHGIFGYADASPALRQAVAARMGRLYAWDVDPAWVVTVPGLVSGFTAAAHALCSRGEGYLVQPPVYMPFNDLGEGLGLLRQDAQLELDPAAGPVRYRIDWAAFEGAFGSGGARTAMFLLCDPHNPVGAAWGEAEQLRMAETAIGRGAVVVSDEIHAELLLDGTRHRPVAATSAGIAKGSITLVAPSKTFNIAGLYCGFAIIPDAALRSAFTRVADRMTLHCSSLSLVAAEAAYSGNCEQWLGELLAYLAGNRDFLSDFIRERMPLLRSSHPEATYLAWLDAGALVRERGIVDPFRFFLEKARVALNDGKTFGLGGAGFLRLNFACPRSTLKDALEKMAAAIDSLR